MRLGGSGHNPQNPFAMRQCLKLEQGLILNQLNHRHGKVWDIVSSVIPHWPRPPFSLALPPSTAVSSVSAAANHNGIFIWRKRLMGARSITQ